MFALCPHNTPQVEVSGDIAPDSEETRPTTAASSWFSEVVELRKKAAEYRMRARGTHFSRTHMAQLYARNAALWDTNSVVSALSLESGTPHRLDAGQQVTLTQYRGIHTDCQCELRLAATCVVGIRVYEPRIICNHSSDH